MVRKKTEKVSTTLSYVENLLILASKVTRCVSFPAFTSLIDVPVGIGSYAATIKVCVTNAGIKKYKSIIKKMKKKHYKIVLLEKGNLNAIEVLISKALINSYLNHEEFVVEK